LDVACVACDALHDELQARQTEFAHIEASRSLAQSELEQARSEMAALRQNQSMPARAHMVADIEASRSLAWSELEEARSEMAALRQNQSKESISNEEIKALREELNDFRAAPGIVVVALRDELTNARREVEHSVSEEEKYRVKMMQQEVSALQEELHTATQHASQSSKSGQRAIKTIETSDPLTIKPCARPVAWKQEDEASTPRLKPLRLQPPRQVDPEAQSPVIKKNAEVTARSKSPNVAHSKIVTISRKLDKAKESSQGQQGLLASGHSRGAPERVLPTRSGSVPAVLNRSQVAPMWRVPIGNAAPRCVATAMAPTTPQLGGLSDGVESLRQTGAHLRHASRLSQLLLGPHEPLGPHPFQSPGLMPEYPSRSHIAFV
jgi:hypothetical protein